LTVDYRGSQVVVKLRIKSYRNISSGNLLPKNFYNAGICVVIQGRLTVGIKKVFTIFCGKKKVVGIKNVFQLKGLTVKKQQCEFF